MEVHVRARQEPWPAVPIGSFRLSDNLTSWAQINKSDGNYDWRLLDEKLTEIEEHGVNDVLYTFRLTPSWASSKPSHNCVAGQTGMPALATMTGSCDPPNDLNADGTGTDKHWKDFVTAIAVHNRNSRSGHIRYWEIWNEPHNEFFWSGTFEQMVRMAHDASSILKDIDPKALVLSPSVGLEVGKSVEWITRYLAAGGGTYADIIAFHGYVHSGKFGVYPSAADLIPRLENFKSILAKYGQNSKTLWDTEASWGNATAMGFDDEDLQAAFLAQFYLLHWSLGVPRLYWFAWNNGTVGTLWMPDPGRRFNPGRLTKAAVAYGELYKWLNGSVMSHPCSQSGDLWSCSITQPGGHEAQIVWAGGGEWDFTPKELPAKMRTLDGSVSTLSGETKINSKPVLFQSQ